MEKASEISASDLQKLHEVEAIMLKREVANPTTKASGEWEVETSMRLNRSFMMQVATKGLDTSRMDVLGKPQEEVEGGRLAQEALQQDDPAYWLQYGAMAATHPLHKQAHLRCDQFAAAILYLLNNMSFSDRIELACMGEPNVDGHYFVVVGRKTGDELPSDPKDWGDETLTIDPWYGKPNEDDPIQQATNSEIDYGTDVHLVCVLQ